MMNNIRVDVVFFGEAIRFILLSVFLTGINVAHAAWHPIDIQDERVLLDPAHIYKKGNTLYFDGKIDDNTDTVVNNLIRKNNIKTLSINSIGGSILPAMNIGLMIHQRGMDVDVRSVCASACANYIFPAGKNKKINTNSYLLWHGSAHSPANEFAIDNNQQRLTGKQFVSTKEFRALAKRELDFYHTIGVQYDMPVCPQRLKDYHQKFPEKWFSYSEETLSKFGVNNIFYAEGKDQWLQHMEKNGVIFANHCR